MDITSFVLGMKQGKNNIKLQEKTAIPGDSKITVTPDEDFDGLSKVIVNAVQSSGGTIVGKTFTFTGSTSYPLKVPHDLGVAPFLIAVYPTSGLYPPQADEMYICICLNTEIRNIVGLERYGWSVKHHASAGAIYSHPTEGIESSYSSPIKNANETTFEIGSSSYKLRSVSYTCTVMGIQE